MAEKNTTANLRTAEYWRKELSEAEKRQKKAFWGDAERIEEIYEGEKKDQTNFNILYSNTETLLPNLYNATPRPVVGRRYKDPDPVGKLAGKVLERMLAYHIDTPDPDYTSFDDLMERATLGACVPGLGLTRIKYEATFEHYGPTTPQKDKRTAIEERGQDDKSEHATDVITVGNPLLTQEKPTDALTYETACGEDVAYNKVLFGPGRLWAKLPWVAFQHNMTRADIKASFPDDKKLVEQLEFLRSDGSVCRDDDEDADMATVRVWEVWAKTTKQVLFIAPSFKERPLAVLEDPLELQGFYPCPEPLILFSRVDDFLPRPLYTFYEEQAKELNRISGRINKLIEALKVRGFYGGGLKGLDQLLTKPDNTLLPSGPGGMDPNGPNPANSIWLVPLEKIIQVLQQLYLQREQVKRVIFELTGLSDIIRGSTVASETATAQGLKSQWGTLRLKKMQKRVQRYVRDYLRIVAEVASKKFAPDTVKAITGVPLPTAEEKQQIQQQLQQLQQQAQSNPQAPPQPPDPKMLEQLKLPTWEDVLSLLKNDLLRNYKIDVETNSTVEPDAVEDQKQVAELMGALAQMFQGVGPAVQSGTFPMPAVKAMLMAVCRRFRFGEEVESMLEQIPDQPPPQQEDKGKTAETQAKVQLVQAETQGKLRVLDKEVQVKEKELQLKEQELALREQELQQKRELNTVKFEGQMQAARAKAATAAAGVMAQAARPAPAAPAPAPMMPGVPNAPV